MRLRVSVLLAAAVVVAVALVAAGCGGGSSGDNKGAAGDGGPAKTQVLKMAWGAEPPSLDPGLATDTTSSNVLLNIMDPLVRLGKDLEPVPALAESWDVNGKVVTFHLRDDGRWTNGDRVTANDFEYSWKRTLDPKLAADYAYQLYGIVGAEAYNNAKPAQAAELRDKVGVKALDDRTLQVTLTSAQPWFVQQAAHHSFLAVHKATVEKHGTKWTEPQNIVTDGPFKLAGWNHDASITLVKNADWRNAADVALDRVEGRIIVDGTTRVQAFEAGEVDALDGGGLPPADMPRLKQLPEYEKYPALGTYYYGFNLKNIPDVDQRRAMAFAIDRQSIIDNVAQADQIPATGMVPKGMPGFEVIEQHFLPTRADLDKAKQFMAKVENPQKKVTLFYNDSPGHKEIAVAVQAMWKELGIDATLKSQEFAQYLEFLGPPPNDAVYVYRLGWIADYGDPMNFLELWTSKSGNNNTRFANPAYDRLIEKARNTPNDEQRYELYRQAEAMLTGPNGAMPIAPIYWYTYTNLERESVKDTFNINPLDQFDLTKVVIKEV
ncbi:MAG TPA: peptide ABC transporter substrate-binding protein [Gaiellaceae bacterium]|nr:peptide ABC transporter substrate-binding protein [Gaiellaceae bacterium]